MKKQMVGKLITGSFLCMAVWVHAQEMQLIDSLFYRSVNAYKLGQFQESLRTLEFMDRVYPSHRRSTGSLLLQGNALYRLHEYQRAIEAYDELIKDFPKSQYVDDALYGKAKAQYQRQESNDAVITLLDLMEQGGDNRIIRKSADLSSDIMNYRLDAVGLETLLKSVHGERGKSAILEHLIPKLIQRGQYQKGKDLLTQFLEQYPKSSYVFQTQKMLRQMDELSFGCIKIGVILPLTGVYADQGKSVLSGIQYALQKFDLPGKTKVELIVRNSGSDIVQAINAAQEICAQPEVVALIGELESEISAGIAAIAQERHVPLIAPTASAVGLTGIGDYIFQLNSNFTLRARALAEYAVSGLGLKSFAILGQADGYGRTMAEGFKRTVESLGGKVLAEKWMYSGDEQLGVQFKSLREFGLQKMLNDSLIVRVSKYRLATLRKRPGVEYVTQSFNDLVDSTGLAVTAYDVIFLPVYQEDLQYVIPQFAKYNFKTRVFGGVPWNDVQLLEDHRRFIDDSYIDGIIFLSDFYRDPSDRDYHLFLNDYRIVMKKNPSKLDVFGYDGASLLIREIQQDRPNRDELVRRLGSIQYQGIQGLISFNKERVNPNVHLLQFRGGRIIQLK